MTSKFRTLIPIDYEKLGAYLYLNYLNTEWDEPADTESLICPLFKRARRVLEKHIEELMCETVTEDNDTELTNILLAHQIEGSLIDWTSVGSVPGTVVKVEGVFIMLPLVFIEQLN